jgi:methylated-DNA-[protein]-cysteine S-methyltransferase
MSDEPLRIVAIATPIGEFTVVTSERGVVATLFGDEGIDLAVAGLEDRLGRPARPATRLTSNVRHEVEAYFRGESTGFSTPADLALVPEGFPRRVLEVTATIPFGELWTYGDVAGMAGGRGAARAAGNALSRCPIELFVPCHRVVHAGGSLGGYGRYEDRKLWLLRHERAV